MAAQGEENGVLRRPRRVPGNRQRVHRESAGDILLEKKIAAEPAAIVHLLKGFGSPFKRIGLEAGPTSSWLYGELRAAGYGAICLECRHVKAGLSAMRNKTDRNDARGIAQLVRLGWFRQVHV